MQEYIQAIQNVLPDAEVHILDPRDDGKHLEGIVISDKFENLSLLEQQRLVMNALKQNFKEGLHALSLKTFSHQQWEVERQYYQELL
jgi:acid stress-induced BolA-like protein IbaG/YrbA